MTPWCGALASLLLAALSFAAGIRAGLRAGPTARATGLLAAAAVLALASLAAHRFAGAS